MDQNIFKDTLTMVIGSEAHLPNNESNRADFPELLEPKT